MKKLIVVLLSAVLLCLFAVPVMAASDEAYTAAHALYEFGLFLGTGRPGYNGDPDFDLDRTPTRHEAVTMLVRLLGKEDEALSGSWETPFTDVEEWAEPYVGYAYVHGLTVGTGDTTFGGKDEMTATQYLTFVLRSLGYANGVDFAWDKAWLLSDALGITDGRYGADTPFTRGDVAIISECSLTARRKGEQEPEVPADLNGLAYEINTDGTSCTVIGIGTCKDTKIVIPEAIDGYTVTAIGEKAFLNCTSVTAIEIPETVTRIGTRAFYGCTGITEMTIPASVTDIGLQIFYKASNLHTVYYNSAYSSEKNAFLVSTASISKVVFDGNSIPDYILCARTPVISITEVGFSGNITSIGQKAFSGCNGLTSITIPDSVTSVGKNAFDDCSNLKNVIISAGIKSIAPMMFSFCSSLEYVTISEGITSIGNSAFYACDNLKSVTIPDTVVTIGNHAFSGCSLLESITIPNSVTTIDYCAFWGCRNLTSIRIPDSVTSIGSSVFSACDKLTNIEIGSGITETDGLFSYCISLESIIIPENITYIGNETFEGCSNLKNITIPNSVTRIGKRAFLDCTALESVKIPDSVKRIGELAFYNCSSLTNITLAEGLQDIDYNVFLRCSALTSLSIPSSVKNIGMGSFNECRNLESIYFNGTKARWNAISDDAQWNTKSGKYIIYCTDGYIE